MTSFTASSAAATATGREVTAVRLNLLRGGYALLAIGLALYVWPTVLDHTAAAASHGALDSLLAGIGATAVLGLRYPLRMLPLLMFEIIWKTIYLVAFALPLYLAHRVDAGTAADIGACLLVLVFIPLIPWRHLVASYNMAPGERWA
jgi:hypothetical protein